MANVTRRRFLTKTAVAAGVVVAGPSLFDVDRLLAAPDWVRPDVASLSSSGAILSGYRTAIKAMRALPGSNPRSWIYQAAIHGTTVSPGLAAWNTCQHGSYFFLSWHRMYLYWWERIVRKMSGNTSWALPFWNYTPTSNRQLPEPFRLPADENKNALYTSHRYSSINDGSASIDPDFCDASDALTQTDFTGPSVNFGGNNPGYGELEQNPHNHVHTSIGGWMGDPKTAAQDPIFWLHHANIDRYWNVWLKQGGTRADPTNDITWRNQVFTFFDENGAAVHMTACDILNASAQLHYTYEGEPAQVTQSCPPKIRVLPPRYLLIAIRIPIPDPEIIVGEARAVTRPLRLKETPADDRRRLQAALASREANVILRFGDVTADANPETVFEVRAGEKRIGTFSLFGLGVRGHEGHGKASFSFRLDEPLREAFARNAAELQIAVVPRDPLEVKGKRGGLKKPAAPLRIRDVAVLIEEPAK